jgi:hypothetical protein
MRTKSPIVSALILAFLLTLVGLVRSEYFPWPDFVHATYGFPIFWLTHQTSAISGPVDLWMFNYLGLAVDMIFWFCIALLSLWILRKIKY